MQEVVEKFTYAEKIKKARQETLSKLLETIDQVNLNRFYLLLLGLKENYFEIFCVHTF